MEVKEITFKEEEYQGNKNKKFNLIYLVGKDNEWITLFGSKFVENNKDKCYLIIDNNDCELKKKYLFSNKGEHNVTIVITDDNINFSEMFSNYSFSHRFGTFSTDFNPYLIDISGLKNLDVSKSKDLRGMFNGCKNIKNFECLKNWNVSNVENLECLFAYCNFTDVNFLSSWNLMNAIDIGGMFYACEKLNNIEGLKNWNVGNVKYFRDQFHGCKGLINVNALQYWNMSSVIAMNGMFAFCNNLVNMDSLFKWKLKDGINKLNIIWGCNKLNNIPSNLDGNNCQIF